MLLQKIKCDSNIHPGFGWAESGIDCWNVHVVSEEVRHSMDVRATGGLLLHMPPVPLAPLGGWQSGKSWHFWGSDVWNSPEAVDFSGMGQGRVYIWAWWVLRAGAEGILKTLRTATATFPLCSYWWGIPLTFHRRKVATQPLTNKGAHVHIHAGWQREINGNNIGDQAKGGRFLDVLNVGL